jgi:GWxTD domain-containing protein
LLSPARRFHPGPNRSDEQTAQRKAGTEKGLQRLARQRRHLHHHRRRTKAFKKLANDDERERFIEEFWRRRDPDPDTEENEFKEEYYERIAYANEHFSSAYQDGKATAAGSGSCTASRTSARLTRWAALTNVHHMKAAAQQLPIRLRSGSIVISGA